MAACLLLWILVQPGLAAPAFDGVFRTSHPGNSVHSASLPLDITLIHGSSPIVPGTVRLLVRGVDVTAASTVRSIPAGVTVRYAFAPRLPRQTRISYEIRFRVTDTNAPPVVITTTFSTDVRASGSFFIESEDFDYGAGRFRAEAASPGYPGGGYQSRSAALGVDFQSGESETSGNSEYRELGGVAAACLVSDQRERGAGLLAQNWVLSAAPGDWFHYTRVLGTNLYQVYAALSHGSTAPAALQGRLLRVGPDGSPVQLGVFSARGNGAWGEDVLVPLVADTGETPLTVSLGGQVTLRYEVGSGWVDYLVLVPVPRLNRLALTPTSITVDWSGDALLEWSTGVAGPFAALPGSATSPATFPRNPSEPSRFLRLQP